MFAGREEEALRFVDKDLEQFPDSWILHSHRFSFLTGTGRYADARDEAEKLYALTGRNEYVFYDCIAREELQAPGDDYMACYQDLYDKLKAAEKPDYELLFPVAVMLNAPDKDDLMRAYLDRLPAEMSDFMKQDILTVGREAFLFKAKR